MDNVFFIDKKGNRISVDGISSHVALANYILENDKELKKEFEQSGESNPANFLLINKGYMEAGGERIVYDSAVLSDEQRRWIRYYIVEEGYMHNDLAMDRKKKLQEGR